MSSTTVPNRNLHEVASTKKRRSSWLSTRALTKQAVVGWGSETLGHLLGVYRGSIGSYRAI